MDSSKRQLMKPIPNWRMDTGAQQIDFVVTEDCNLRCKYCYICNKRSNRTLDFESAKKFIDYLFSGELELPPAVILGFIGGEPFLETKLIDKITDYFKFKAYETGSPWYWNYCISITTNGVNYSSQEVQKYIRKNKDKMSLTITIDGTKEKHDLQRVFPDGSGSYDGVAKNIPLYLQQFPPTTKVTFAHADINLLFDSIVHLFDIGITMVSANVVFEDVWEDGDDQIFEAQLKKLADYMISTEAYKTCSVSLFDENIGAPLTEEGKKNTVCGAGLMLALGTTGKIYPCLRYKDYSLENHDEIVIGHADTGIDYDKVIRFRFSTNDLQFDEECLNCEVAAGCGHCQAYNYDSADTPTNYQRSKAICRMNKARVRANNYYFNRLYNEKGIERSGYQSEYKKMYFILDDDFVSFCEYDNSYHETKPMEKDILEKALKYSAYEFFSPVFVHSYNHPNMNYFTAYPEYKILHIISARFYEQVKNYKNYILVFDRNTLDINVQEQVNCILNVQWDDIHNLSSYVKELFSKVERINLNLLGTKLAENLDIYRHELNIIRDFICNNWEQGNMLEFNKLTDVFFNAYQETCVAGERNLAIGPDGNFYTCPAGYKKKFSSVGNIYNERKISVKNKHLYSYEYAPLCKECPATQCVRCGVTNLAGTGEVHIPPTNKCQQSIIEYNVSVALRKKLEDEKGEEIRLRKLPYYKYITPFKCYEENNNLKVGYRMAKLVQPAK